MLAKRKWYGTIMAKLKHPTEKSGKGIGALDVFIVLALVLCVAGAALRIYMKRSDVRDEPQLEDYLISFEVKDIRTTSSELFSDGEVFYIKDTGEAFGKISGNVSITPAELYVTDSEGNYILTYSPDNGDSSRIDVSGTMLVSGYCDENGVFLLGGSTILTPNRTFDLRSKSLTVTMTVTAISKAASSAN